MLGVDVVFLMLDWQSDFRLYLEDRVAPRSVAAYLQDLRIFTAWYEGEIGKVFEPSLLTSTDLRRFRAWSIEGRCSPATWNRRREALRQFCRFCVGKGYVSYDPFQGVEAWEEVELPPRWLSGAEFNQLMRQVEIRINGARTEFWRWQAVRDGAMIALMVFGGLREGEVVNLRIDDVVLSDRKGRVIIWNGKGGKKREVPLGREARWYLRMWLDIRGNDGVYLFVGKGGKRISTRLVQRRVEEYGRLAGLDLSPHMLRHTFAKRLLDEGVPLTVVSKLLGHKRVDTTARYVKPGWDDLEKAVEEI